MLARYRHRIFRASNAALPAEVVIVVPGQHAHGGNGGRTARKVPLHVPLSLTVVDGGRSLSDEQIERESVRAWGRFCDLAEEIIASLHPGHPERGVWLEMLADARPAARRPSGSLVLV